MENNLITLDRLIGGPLVHPHHLDQPGDFVCPHCLAKGNYNDNQSGYQMNDIVNEVFCSYECSKEFTHKHKDQLIKHSFSEVEINESI